MPRVSREQADCNRATITEVSARLFRERGINGLSVSDLMAAAGLTHGGFYGHFESKDALAAEACELAFQHSTDRWMSRVGQESDSVSAKAALVEAFLSPKARASPGTSCPTTALAADVARENPDAPIRRSFTQGVEGLVEILASLQHRGDTSTDRREALGDLSTMVGALILARATAGKGISDEFLAAGRDRLKPVSKPQSSVRRVRR
jgi:TetR/AcrR family transcriptional regulator, transcriptional repressor for nem operon